MHLHPLNFSETETEQLREQYRVLLRQLEKGQGLQWEYLKGLQEIMQGMLHAQRGLQDFWKKVKEQPYEHYHLHLTHGDKELLNLPWQLAIDSYQYPFIRISKGLPASQGLTSYQPKPAPLKILVMISSPEDINVANRLSYEQEEEVILKALGPLWESGQVHVDFTEDGSLQSLQEQLELQHYHILHFSGHGIYKDNTGYLLLEDEETLESKYVTAQELAITLMRKPDHKPAVVILASCQTGQGNMESGFRGVADELMKINVPAVIAMAFSVIDYYAIVFSANLYECLAKRDPLLNAYAESLKRMQQKEEEHLNKKGEYSPTQWLIPQLYINQHIENVVNWQSHTNVIKASKGATKFIKEGQFLFLKHHKNYQFVGRRRECARFFGRLLRNEAVLIRGQGGVGKTSMAEHLVRRMLMHDPRYHYFDFGEADLSIPAMITRLQEYLEKEHRLYDIKYDIDKREKAVDKIDFLLQEVVQRCSPLWVFDNMEICQEGIGGTIKNEYKDWLDYIRYRLVNQFPVIFTGRYLIEELGDIYEHSLNQVFFVDFYRKCLQLSIYSIQQSNLEISFGETVQLLFNTLGGNFRAVEFFDEIYKNEPQRILTLLNQLRAREASVNESGISRESKMIASEVQDRLETYAKKMVFDELRSLLNEEEELALQLLSQFRIPALELALQMQVTERDFSNALKRLCDLTLIEVHQDNNNGLDYYYVTPLVKNWLASDIDAQFFLHFNAGKYYAYAYEQVNYGSYYCLKEAFWHFLLSKDIDKINEYGNQLSAFYYKRSLFKQAEACAEAVDDLARDNINADVIRRLGEIYYHYGDYDMALNAYRRAHDRYMASNNKLDQALVINYISNVYKSWGDHDKALSYLNESLSILEETDNKQIRVAVLVNISQNYARRGDHHKALNYLQEGLAICTNDDYTAKTSIFNDLAVIHLQLGDTKMSLEYFTKSLEICELIDNLAMLGKVHGNISSVYNIMGEYEMELIHIEKSLTIARSTGDRLAEGAALHNLSGIMLLKGDFDSYMQYELDAYKIHHAINNMEGIYYVGRDLGYYLCKANPEMCQTGLKLLRRSYEIGSNANYPGVEELALLIEKFSKNEI